MELILIRHGEPVTVQTDGEPADPELSERGFWQAERVSHWLACEPIDCVITSSKTRAKQTVAPLAEHLDIEPLEIPDLDEIDRRSTVYAPFQIMPERFPDYWKAIQEQRWSDIGWDSLETFRERVIGAWEHILEQRPGARVAIGCHGGVIGVLAAHVTGVPQQWAFANPPFASFSRVVIAADGRAQVQSLNEVGHFDATRRRVIGPDGEGFEGKGFMQALAESRT
jgi:probable phosphoglycerate mutase